MEHIGTVIPEIEGECLEFKREAEEKSGGRNILRTIVAFANTSGGSVLIGVDDKTREVVGIPSDQAVRLADDLTNAIADACVPAVPNRITLESAGERMIVRIRVWPGSATPYHLKSLGPEKGTFVRVNATTRPADESWLEELRLRGLNRRFDRLEVAGAAALTEQEIEAFCHMLRTEAGENREARADEVRPVGLAQLVAWGVVREREGAVWPTNAYFLLCGTHPHIRSAEVRCALFKGKEPVDFLDRKVFAGTLFEQFRSARRWLQNVLRVRSHIRDGVRKDYPEIPGTALRELLVNALCHRSYLYDGAAVHISVFDDRVEIRSPGPIPASLSVSEIVRGTTYFRNEAIARVLHYVGLIEHWGTGIPRALARMRLWGLPDLVVEDLGSAVNVRLMRPTDDWPDRATERRILAEMSGGHPALPQDEKVDISGTSLEEKVLEALRSDPSLSLRSLARLLGRTDGSVRGALNRLRASGAVERIGNGRSGRWVPKNV